MEMRVLEMCDDDQMASLRSSFLKSGKGRRPDLPPMEATNKLLLQLYQLRFEGNVSILEVERWFLKLFPEFAPFTEADKLWKMMQRLTKAANSRSGEGLSNFLEEEINLLIITDALHSVGITRLMKRDKFIKCHLTNQHMIDLGNYLLKEGYSYQFFLEIVESASLTDVIISKGELRQKYLSADRTKTKLVKNKNRNPEALISWLSAMFFSIEGQDNSAQQPSSNSAPQSSEPPPPSSNCDWPPLQVMKEPPTSPTRAPGQCQSTASSVPKLINIQTAGSSELHSSVMPVLDIFESEPTDIEDAGNSESTNVQSPRHSESDSSALSVQDTPEPTNVQVSGHPEPDSSESFILESKLFALREEFTKLKLKVRDMRKSLTEFKNENVELKRNIKQLKRSKIYKANHTLKKKDLENKTKIKLLGIENNNLKEEITCLKKDKILLQKNLSKSKIKYSNLKAQSESLEYTLNMINHLDNNDNLNLKDDRFNRFNDSVRVTYMALQGEANVSASNCSKVVQLVTQHLFNQTLSLDELPSTSSALSMMREGNHIAKCQLFDEIKKSDHFTFASDKTSRQKQHYMERHIVLNTGKGLSMGYSSIASDDANSMFEQIIRVFQDFIDVACKDLNEVDKNKAFKEIIRKMSSLMSDRAANMKLLNRKIHEWRKNVLGDEDITTHFLYCNAHFLLGLFSATEKAVVKIEEDIVREGSSLGRDSQQQKFKQFLSSKESAALRAIRTAAEVLGPRGDEKSGSRFEWINFCSKYNFKSKFCSYRSNRFNNVFENAHALLFHHEDIIKFLTEEVSGDNLKLHSVIADLQDDRVVSIVAAISLFNLTITGPYWKLMNSSLPYGSFPTYVRKMKSSFDAFLSMSYFDESKYVSVFTEFSYYDTCTLELIRNNCCSNLVLSTFKTIVEESNKVLERQLFDFLDDGVFGGEISVEVKKVLDNCPLTNLIGERLFGDLDCDMHKRRRASLHLRSTLSMWKHNKTFKWFCGLGEEKQNKILEAARRNSNYLVNQSKKMEIQVKERVKEKMNENKRKRNDRDIKSKRQKASILDAIIADGGVCRTKEELDILFKNGNMECLRNQIRYRKIFLGEKHLKVGGNVMELYDSLLKQIEEDVGQSQNQYPDSKRRRVSSSSEEENTR